MRREAPVTPKSRRFNRTMALTPDRSRSNSTDASNVAPRSRFASQRSTMAPNDFSAPAPGLFGRDRLTSSRQSMMPLSHAQSFLDITRKPEVENKDLEIKLLYDKYLQTTMMEFLMKRKVEDIEKIVVSQLGVLVKEEDTISEKLLSMKTKERGLKILIELQNSLDTQIAEIKSHLAVFDKKPVEILTQLQTILVSLDTLKCKNIIIPDTTDEMNKIHDLFAKCANLLQSINNMIGSKSNTMSTVNKGLKDFTKSYTDVRDHAKKTEEVLGQLQILILKEGARSLRRNEP